MLDYDIAFQKAFDFLEHDESILSNMNCCIDIDDSSKRIEGMLIVTNKRMFFYSIDKNSNLVFKEYQYENMTEIKKYEKEKEFTLFFGCDKKVVELKNIISNNLAKVIAIVNKKVANSKMLFIK